VRRRYSRILLEAREANPEAAEFSQENPAEALHRLRHGDQVPLDNLPITPQDPSTSLRSGRDDKNGGRSGPADEKSGRSGRDDEHFVAVRLPDLIIVDGGKASSRLPARNFSGLGYTICQLSGWRRSTRRYIDRGERCRCTCRKIQAPCVYFSASVMKRIVSPTLIINY